MLPAFHLRFLLIILRLYSPLNFSCSRILPRLAKPALRQTRRFFIFSLARVTAFTLDWILTTNHKRLALLYFLFVACAGLVGLVLATVIRLELSYPGQLFIVQSPERYLTVASLHGIVMVFFMIIPLIFGAFGNFLLPLQLGVRDVAFPRLNSFMFWVTPSGLVLLMHVLFFDRAHTATHWVSYNEQRAQLRRRYLSVEPEQARLHSAAEPSVLASRLAGFHETPVLPRALITRTANPALANTLLHGWDSSALRVKQRDFGLSSLGLGGNHPTTPFADCMVHHIPAGLSWQLARETQVGGNLPSYTAAAYYDTPKASALGWPLHTSNAALAQPQPSVTLGQLNLVYLAERGQSRLTAEANAILPTWLYASGRRASDTSFSSSLAQSFIPSRLSTTSLSGVASTWVSTFPSFHLWSSTRVLGALTSSCVATSPSIRTTRNLAWLPSQAGVSADYWADWRELRLERELWRSLDLLGLAHQQVLFRRKFYANFFEPASLANRVSIWLPNRLIPGWAFITPYTSRLRYTALGKVDIALIVVLVAALGSVFSSINYLITYRYLGAPLLHKRRELRSFFIDSLLVASRMIVLANPALILGILLLLSDRHFGTSVFDFSGGGDAILFQHLFWFFGHPEVYIIILPCFGFMNSLLPTYLRKRLSGRLALQFSIYTIALMGFLVWGHHMYMVGLANSVRTLYSTMTVMISVPASTKVLHWSVTLLQANWVCDVGFLFLLSFLYFFVLGGLSGMFVAHIGFDVIFHDTFYVIGHFHVMLAGAAMSSCFAAFYFYFSAIFGVRYSRFFAYLHFFFYIAGQLLTLAPMFWLGYSGMPRRVLDYPATLAGWHSIVSSGHLLTVLSLGFFCFMLLDSFYEGRASTSRAHGVSRLSTRLAFAAYEQRKLRYCQARALSLQRVAQSPSSRLHLYKFCLEAEQTAWEYTYTSSQNPT